MNDKYEGEKYNTLYSYKPTFVISEVTNLNNTWNNKSVRADMLKSGETDLAKTEIATYTTEDFEILRVETDFIHGAGYSYKFSGEAFTNFIKGKISAGNKIVNLCVEITDIDKYRNEEISTGYGIWVYGN